MTGLGFKVVVVEVIAVMVHIFMYSMCVCVYIYIYMCVCKYIHTHTHTSIVHIYIYIYIYTYTHIYIYIYINVCSLQGRTHGRWNPCFFGVWVWVAVGPVGAPLQQAASEGSEYAAAKPLQGATAFTMWWRCFVAAGAGHFRMHFCAADARTP